MGFVTIEDVQGNVELVVFPRTWDQYWETFDVDNVVLVDGKVDAQSGDPKVLVDTVTADLKTIVSSGPPIPPPTSNASQNSRGSTSDANISGVLPDIDVPISKNDVTIPGKAEVLPAQAPALEAEVPAFRSKRPNGATTASSKGEPWENPHLPRDEFPPDWNALELTPGGFILEVGGKVAEVTVSKPASAIAEVVEAAPGQEVIETVAVPPTSDPGMLTSSTPSAQKPVDAPPVVGIGLAAIPLEPVVPPEIPLLAVDLSPAANIPSQPGITGEPNRARPPYISNALSNTEARVLGAEVPNTEALNFGAEATPTKPELTPARVEPQITALPYILPPAEAYAGQDLHMITVILRCGPDKVRDNLRLRQCYGIMISYSGHDRFALQIFERNRGYRIEFPNYTTLFSSELVGRLASIVGADNVIVESLRLH